VSTRRVVARKATRFCNLDQHVSATTTGVTNGAIMSREFGGFGPAPPNPTWIPGSYAGSAPGANGPRRMPPG
jgi:hypothetical protein